jgi:hypothetical protein
MAGNEYAFLTRWRVQGTAREVYDILSEAPDLVRWWPSVYLEVKELEHGDADGLGKRISLYTKGWLPYTLRWNFVVTEVRKYTGFSLEAQGDFVGRGVWVFTQDGEWVDITYDWRIRADKALLKYLSFMFKPMFSANHRWAMAKGEESLKLELLRRHPASDAERARVPAPPKATFSSTLGFLGFLVLKGGRG